MTNNENENHDVDIDTQEDFDREPVQKASLKDTWDSNPLLKIAAVIIVIALLAGGYVTFFGSTADNIKKATIAGSNNTTVKATPGKGADVEYLETIKRENEQNAKNAVKSGSSAMPIVLAPSQEDKLAVPPSPAVAGSDPLQEWRAKAEARRMQIEEAAPPPEENEMPAADVPVVQPIRPQQTVKMDPNAAKVLAEQMRAIINTQVPKNSTTRKVTMRPSPYSQKLKVDAEAEKKKRDELSALAATTDVKYIDTNGNPVYNQSAQAQIKVIVPAGNIAYAQLLNDLNSDVQGPALAQILSGPFEGGRAIGDFQRQDEYLTLNFKRIVKDGVSYSINGIALDENTTLAAQQTDVDHHYFQRIILPAAAQFLTGYTQAAAQVATTSSAVPSAGVVTTSPAPDAKQQLMQGATQAATSISNVLTQDQGRPITVYVQRGTTMGILFMDPVTTGNAQ